MANGNSEWVTADAPSNIALIKYMGKVAQASSSAAQVVANRATNSSISWTLDHLKTRVRVRWESGLSSTLVWRPLVAQGFHAPSLSAKGEARFLAHAERCLKAFEVSPQGSLAVESANGFPSDCGLASSASSFAALTMAIAKLSDVKATETLKFFADVSRQGSGSSCRSFFSPWCAWTAAGAEPVLGLPEKNKLRHLAVIVDESKKMVSSSEAHLRVASSELFKGRIERAETRFQRLIELLREANQDFKAEAQPSGRATLAWNEAVDLVWAEFWDMHALFETAAPPFGYFTENSIRVLNAIREVSLAESDGARGPRRKPMATMDAGPNVHVLLWRDEFENETVRELKSRWGSDLKVIDSNDL